MIPDVGDVIGKDSHQQRRSGPAKPPGDPPHLPQLLVTLRLFGSGGGTLCFLAGIEKFQRQAKLVRAAVALRPGAVWSPALPPSDGVCEIRTAPQLGIALLPAQCPVAQALIGLCELSLVVDPVRKTAPLTDQAFMAEIEKRVFIQRPFRRRQKAAIG